jgi:hypothetical protein
MLLDLLRATVELGLPVAALSWLFFYRLYSRGELARDADHKAIRSGLKQIRAESKRSQTPADGILHTKWMKFGGGFYGAVALWTIIVLEAGGVVSMIAHPSSIEEMFRGGLVEFIVSLLTSQITTFVQAFTWFTWWSGRGHDPLVWIVVAYAGYIAGLNLARRETALGDRLAGLDWRARLRSWFGGRKDIRAQAPNRIDPVRGPGPDRLP